MKIRFDSIVWGLLAGVGAALLAAGLGVFGLVGNGAVWLTVVLTALYHEVNA